MASSSAPPPYTPGDVPAPEEKLTSVENKTPSAETLKLRLYRFLIDSIAFMYEVDAVALRHAMSKSTFASLDNFYPGSIRWSAILRSDREALLNLATIVSTTSEKVSKQQLSSITTADCTLINTNVIIPAKALLVHPCYAMRLLRVYAVHKGIDRYKAGHFDRKSRLLCGGWRMLSQAAIAERLLSDDKLAELIAPNEETRVLLGEAIAKFGDKHLTDTKAPKMKRCLYANQVDVDLEKFVEEKAAALKKNRPRRVTHN